MVNSIDKAAARIAEIAREMEDARNDIENTSDDLYDMTEEWGPELQKIAESIS